MATETVLFAFGLTLFAGLATGIGSALAFFARTTNTRFLSIALGFSAGVMIYVSFVEIFFKARQELTASLGTTYGTWATVGAFFGGIALIGIIDKLVPNYENPHELHSIEEMDHGLENLPRNEAHDFRKLHRMGLFTALAIGIHNFPEGLATFTAAITDPNLGVAIAIAIAIHNIPEGIAVSVPIYYATGSRRKAFKLSFLSGLSEPAGALIGYLLLMPFFSPTVFGLLFAAVAGIMVFISLDELLPAAEEYGEHHSTIYGLIAGMGVMALSLLLFL
ncbi:MAG: zinc transporter ZupT [Deltaproteobacteria bacterium]|jgi:ZIP family zinc transporter|nr:zinc transporter ZupT [Deltaproteobacteria bacterium]MBW2477932.1 zinc transporter ZupT [Deltaproteobacteria bacterium]MBW2504968.1 zinc transporter ZupT [Deltaproteobacteria bacterium]MBW2519275.1 zinc transporter ZupT [Deltaproteobacteria bacterium]